LLSAVFEIFEQNINLPRFYFFKFFFTNLFFCDILRYMEYFNLSEYLVNADVPTTSRFCGVDEAGRGPLAGDVYSAAVILPPDINLSVDLPGLNDSKKLSATKRERLFDLICAKADAFAIATASIEEIERLNILRASLLAMNRAVNALTPSADFALIDGNQTAGIDVPALSVIGGDGKVPAIAAASILAKVARDRYMAELAKQYPQYAFERHNGYGTKLHYERIREFGVSPVHRPSFLRKMTSDE
jgi:ribonuclease HII